jgi:hypothetical protein
MTTSIAPYLLCTKGTTTQQENERGLLRREAGQLRTTAAREGELFSQRFAPPSEISQLESLCQGNFLRDRHPQSGQSPAVSPARPSEIANPENPVTVENIVPDLDQTPQVADNNGDAVVFDTFSSRLLGETLQTLQFPMLDVGIFEDIPSLLLSSAQTDRSNQRRSTSGHKILACMAHIHSEQMVIHEIVEGLATVQSIGPLLRFSQLSSAQRKCLLLEILSAHRTRALTEQEVTHLKMLPIFTSREGEAVAVASSPGVYWCSSEAALESLSETYSIRTSNALRTAGDRSRSPDDTVIPVVLVHDVDLRPLYDLVGAEELTPSTVVRRFTLPSLNRMDGPDRLRVMSGLALQWDSYRGDPDLVNLLKSVAFVPSYTLLSNNDIMDQRPADENLDFSRPFRKPDQLFSWTNHDLMLALPGPSQQEYYSPPSLR